MPKPKFTLGDMVVSSTWKLPYSLLPERVVGIYETKDGKGFTYLLSADADADGDQYDEKEYTENQLKKVTKNDSNVDLLHIGCKRILRVKNRVFAYLGGDDWIPLTKPQKKQLKKLFEKVDVK